MAIHQAQTRTRYERKELIKLLVDTTNTSEQECGSLLASEGIAKHLADDEDPQPFVNRPRGGWDI